MIKFYTHVLEHNGANPRYDVFARVLRYSSGDVVTVRNITCDDRDLKNSCKLHGTYFQNTRKTIHHEDLIARHDDGEYVALLDADMFVLRAIHPELLEAVRGADIAITYRGPHDKFKFNSGLFVTRVSSLTRRLHAEWVATCKRFLANPREYRRYAHTYGGINQSSLACVLEQSEFKAINIAKLSTLEWNAIVSDHASAVDNARIVHILGPLRREILSSKRTSTLSKLWEAQYDGYRVHNCC